MEDLIDFGLVVGGFDVERVVGDDMLDLGFWVGSFGWCWGLEFGVRELVEVDVE